MNDADFDFIRGFLKARSGLALSPEKRYLVESRLGPICRKYNLSKIEDMVGVLRGGRNPALDLAVIDAMTTNETYFFRDKTPFDIFRNDLLPYFLAHRMHTRRMRIWCAASSTGQEPYSLAMILDELGSRLGSWQVEIIATDICTEVLEKAKAGIYSQFEVQRGLPVQLLLKYFKQVGDSWQITSHLRAKVDFRPLNLIHDFASLGTFDMIFCRNVLIYFDGPTKSSILKRMTDRLAPDGYLMLGSAETVIGLTDALKPHETIRGLYVPSKGGSMATKPTETPAVMKVAAGR